MEELSLGEKKDNVCYAKEEKTGADAGRFVDLEVEVVEYIEIVLVWWFQSSCEEMIC